jgi:hypothetical protein
MGFRELLHMPQNLRMSLVIKNVFSSATKPFERSPYDPSVDFKRNSERAHQRISLFAEKTGLTKKEITVNGCTFVILNMADGAQIPEEKIKKYADQYLLIKDTIGNNCFYLAEDAVSEGVATGMIASQEGDKLTGRANHCINYDILPDGSVVSIDLTASINIDWFQGNFQIFIIRQPDLNALLEKINELCEGAWKEVF